MWDAEVVMRLRGVAMRAFRVILSFIVCGWLVFLFELIGRLSFRICDDFAKLALLIVGPTDER
jgi:hypothetical protein